jgi:hypothetical protein
VPTTVPRRKHFAVEGLSDQAQAVVQRGLDEGWTLERIVEAVAKETGEKLAMSSLHRWSLEDRMRKRIERAERARDNMLAALKADPDGKTAQAVRLLVEEALVERGISFDGKEQDELLDELTRQQRLEIAHKKVAIDEQFAKAATIKAVAAEKQAEAALTQADAAVERVKLMREKMREAERKLGAAETKVRAGQALTAEELRELRLIVGVDDEEGDDAQP